MAVTQNNLLFNEPSSPLALDGPLPDEVVGSAGNALTRYRMYPVFSSAWFKGRLKLGAGIIAVWTAWNALAVLWRFPNADWLLASKVAFFIGGTLLLMISLGPWAAGRILSLSRKRLWSRKKEVWAIVAVILGCAIIQVQPNEWVGDHLQDMIRTPAEKAETALRKAYVAKQPFAVRAGLNVIDYSTTLLLFFCFGGGIAAFAFVRERERLGKYEKNLQLRAAQEAKRETELRLSVLQAQVEPHFLFNTLASLRSLIAQDPPRASALLDKLVDYLRSTIPHTQADGTPVACTLGLQMEAAHSYLELMQMRMGAERLAFKVDCDKALRTQSFPPLMLITLVENAIKHGLEPLAAGGAVHINAHSNTQAKGTPLQSEQLVLSVADNGRGFGGAAVMGTGIGLANTRMRLQHLYGGKAQFELIPEARSDWLATLPTRSATARPGFTAVISVPMNS
jgi:signal transduction histidine kinase